MKIDRFRTAGCCGSIDITLKLSSPLHKDFLTSFIAASYQESPLHTKSNIFYIENIGLVATGAFGSDTLQIKCKLPDDKCRSYVNDLEGLLTKLE